MRALRSFFVAGAIGATSLVGVMAAPAGAAGAPPNDNPGGAKVVNGVPFTWQQSTKGATSSDAERKINRQCGAPAIRKGVWFKFNAGSSFLLKASAAGTSYDVGLILATGPAANPTVVSCGPVAVLYPVEKGKSYWLLVFDAVPGSAGGTLRLQLSKALPQPTVSVTVNPTGVAKGTGAARLFGSASCKGRGAQLLNISASVVQNGGTATETFGFLNINLTVQCGNTPITWQADAIPQPRFNPDDPEAPPLPAIPFKPGPADVLASAFACNIDQCGFAEKIVTINLRKP